MEGKGILWGIVGLGLALRLWGLMWGLPERPDIHPDEHDYVIRYAKTVSFAQPDPGFLNYPSFLCYSTALVAGILRRWDVVREDWQVHLVGRAIVALYGTLTIPAVWALARRLKATAGGACLAALWVALLPLHVWESHIAVTDVVMTFWVILVLYHSLGLLKSFAWSRCAWAGLCLGLAVGSKYTAAFVALAPVLAMAAAPTSTKRRIIGLLLMGGVALAACFTVTPFSFLRFRDLLKAMAYEYAHVHSRHLGFSLPAAGLHYRRYLYQLVAAWPFSFGLPLYVCAAVGALWSAVQRRKDLGILCAFALLFFGVTGSWTFTPLRYYMPLVVLGAVCAALWQDAWMRHHRSSWKFRTALLSIAVALLYTFAFTVSTTRRFTEDTRLQAARWFKSQLSPDQIIHGFGWHRYLAYIPGHPQFQFHSEAALRTASSLTEQDLIQLTSLHYLRWERHGDDRYMRLYEQVRMNPARFTRVAVFDAPFLNRNFYGLLDPMFRSYFVSPTLEIYRVTSRLPEDKEDSAAGHTQG